MKTGRNREFGKLTSEIRAWVPPETEEGIATLAALAGQPKGAYLRNLVMCHVHGHLSVASLRQGGSPEQRRDGAQVRRWPLLRLPGRGTNRTGRTPRRL
jgi:hypothetical protein